jgi:hypothetical protein
MAEPRVKLRAQGVDDRTYRLRANLDEIDVLRVARGRAEEELVEGGTAPKRHRVADARVRKDLDESARYDKVLLFDLRVGASLSPKDEDKRWAITSNETIEVDE